MKRMTTATVVVLTAGAAFAALAMPPAAQAEAPACAPAGTTGLTARVVASTGQHVSGTVDAHGCDVGVYIGPAAGGASVVAATVTGANDHGIFVQDAADVVIAHSVITGNGVHRNANVPEDKAVELAGTTDATVVDNQVVQNNGGGIGLADDGPLDPGAVLGHPGTARPSTGNNVTNNVVSRNLGDCAIVVTAKNRGTGASDNTVAHNVLDDVPNVFPPTLGGIVLAGQSVDGNHVVGNTIHGSFMPGIVVHSSRPDTDVSDNDIVDNDLSADDWGRINGPSARVAIILATASQPAGRLDGTVLVGNRIASDEDYGIYEIGATNSIIAADQRNKATVPIYVA